MAESSSAGGSVPWWKSLTLRKKSKEATEGAQPSAEPAVGELTSPAPPSPDWTSSSMENQDTTNLFGNPGEPYKFCVEKLGNSRRNLKISRSGRFKEKRKVRASLLPEGIKSPEEASSPGDSQEERQ
ncbi:proline-rich protein 15 [Dasypus novemcinctus]|uniref:proline-rich protein 15 n=1 Tax=Dasypus novemcinctus TaxID=9361 RepID=UPI0003288EE7|nr:proline-rich protein 15 [Dasypus novemcinctus]XP_012379905.1 proline-rich protein 15 [Dasypus novemcinctus]